MSLKSRYMLSGEGCRSEVHRLLGEGWVVLRQTHTWEPPTDVYENKDGLVIQVEIAGMCKEDFSITLEERKLAIEGIREDLEPKQAYHQMEIGYGPFRVEVFLPWSVDPEQVEAVYEQGFLRVFLPRPAIRRVPILKSTRCE